MLVRQNFCSLCSELVSLASEYKQCCRNSDQMVCIEACAKLSHTACFCAMTNLLDHGMLTKLGEVCSWCNDVCGSLGVNQSRQCCKRFHACCSEICDMTASQPLYRGVSDIDHEAVLELGRACQALYCKGIVEKPGMLLESKLDCMQIAHIEACLKVCSCISFMCMNTCAHIDSSLTLACGRLCKMCFSHGFCASEIRACLSACEGCTPRLPSMHAKTKCDTPAAPPHHLVHTGGESLSRADHGRSDDVSNIIGSLLDINSYHT